MVRNRLFLFVLLMAGIALVLAQEASQTGGFTVLHRSAVPENSNLEIVMGILERDQKSTSSKHYHPGGEFGFVIDGAVTIQSKNQDPVTVEEGSSFHQVPGEWHIVSTSDGGAKTILFRVVKKGEPMVVEVD